MTYFIQLEQITLELMWKHKRLLLAKIVLEKTTTTTTTTMELDKSGSLIQTILTTKLQPSKQYGSGTKTAM